MNIRWILMHGSIMTLCVMKKILILSEAGQRQIITFQGDAT